MISARRTFEQVIAKGIRDPSSVRAGLDQAEAMAKHFHGLIHQYLLAYRSPAIPAHLTSFYDEVSLSMIVYGMFMHSICFGSNNRARFKELDQACLYGLWAESAARALSTLSIYSRDNQGVPDAVFRELYSLDAEPRLLGRGGWWWKRARI